jgi:hypothetical protein
MVKDWNIWIKAKLEQQIIWNGSNYPLSVTIAIILEIVQSCPLQLIVPCVKPAVGVLLKYMNYRSLVLSGP